ncbi:hypothetical protein BDF20DRAFT_300810 [Mycotypha africana]|uniref:uncharacterized protein n=1 Tax=Mycotypha africana TaxID=64632 RepID=UPI00230134C7|nr:uncharacterized protein BDF20DRAFT_300810 [Mycotypha africana]KAI8988006.1 hypothetical protein BDF20DRAFT_300810 [Mycotypha africana]
MSPLYDYVNQVQNAYIHQDEQLFSSLFNINIATPTVLSDALMNTREDQVENIVNSQLEDISYALAEATHNYLKWLRCLSDPDRTVVFETFTTLYSSLIPLFNGSDSFFQLPVVKTLSTAFVQLAFDVDKTRGLKGKARKANTAARLLSKMFNIMLADRSPMETSKRQGIFHVTNLAFKVYFKLNNIRMCQTFMSNIRTGGVELEQFPISEQVTYKYYTGRYALYHGRLKQAEEYLLFAFNKCHIDYWNNKRLILHYLIPTRIILGYFPSLMLLRKYQLEEYFAPLMRCIRSGHMAGFLHHLEAYFAYFYRHFTYLLLKERGVVLIWRCLIKNLYRQQQILGNTKPAIDFDLYLTALYTSYDDRSYNPQQQQQEQPKQVFDLNDVEGIFVSLISQGYIRGYLQHQRHRIVLSKVNAFPAISSVHLHVERYNETLMEEHMTNAQPAMPPEIQEIISNGTCQQ